VGDAECDDGRPQGAGNVLPACNKCDRLAPPAIEPAADVDDQRNVDCPSTEKSKEHAVAGQKLPWSADRGERKTGAQHDCAKENGRANTEALGNPAEGQRAGAGAEPG
jgi:hypothetical protein